MRKLIALLGVGLILWAVIAVYQTPNGIQVVNVAPAELPVIREETCAVHAICDGVGISTPSGKQSTAELYAINQRYTEFYPLRVQNGRLLYRQEAQQGADVCVITQSVAFALFTSVDPVGQELDVNGVTYRVVGVVADATQIGTPLERRVYVPYEGVKGTFKTLVRTDSYFEETPQGTQIVLSKERMRALLLARLVLCYVGFSLLARYLAFVRRTGRQYAARQKEKLKEKYMRQMFLSSVMPVVGIVLLWAAFLAALVWLMTLLVAPAQVFVEWVPEVLVEWDSISAMFWKNMRLGSETVVLKTQELIIFEHWGYVCNIGCILVLLGIGRISELWKRKKA